MPQIIESILEQVRPATFLDIGITALLIYWLFSLIRGTSAVRLVIGVTVLFAVYFAARALSLRLLTQILETSAVVGVFALVVVFQPELRRALDRIGRVGSLGWLLSAEGRSADLVANEVSRAAAGLSAEGHGALIVIERETGLEQLAESGVMIHGDLSADLLRTIFSPRSPLHDGAVIIRRARIVAAGAVLPLVETTIQAERFGTRHRAALGATEQTDAVVVVVSEENSQISLVQRARIVRNLSEAQLARALRSVLEPNGDRPRFRLPGTVASARMRRAGSAIGAAKATGTPETIERSTSEDVPEIVDAVDAHEAADTGAGVAAAEAPGTSPGGGDDPQAPEAAGLSGDGRAPEADSVAGGRGTRS